VTPVAGGVADAEENGFVFVMGSLKGFLAPGIPVHRVISVLKQVGTGLFGKAVCHFISIRRFCIQYRLFIYFLLSQISLWVGMVLLRNVSFVN
jgi:hypothetical protein